MIKKTAVTIFKKLGYKIEKSEDKGADLALYRNIFSQESISKKRFYNIGAGSFRHPFWTNIDFENEWYSDVQKEGVSINYDLFSLKRLPIKDNTAEIVYSSHTVEHINDEAAQNMFNEAYRILKKGGLFRFTTPNIDLEYMSYKTNDRTYFYWINTYSTPKEMDRIKIRIPMNKASIQQIFLYHFAASASELHIDKTVPKINDKKLDELFSTLSYEDALNFCTSKCSLEVQKKHPGNHINWWNEDKATRMLQNAGFSTIYRSGYSQSASPVLRNTSLFDNTHPKISLYIEARK